MLLKGNLVVFKILVFPPGTLSQSPDLENIASAYRSSKRLSSRKVDAQIAINWTVVGQLNSTCMYTTPLA